MNQRTARVFIVAFALAAPLILGARSSPSGQAQDQTEPRLSALETTVAGQGTQLTELIARVTALESTTPAAEARRAATPASGAVAFTGNGEAVKKVHLAAGLYTVTGRSGGGFFSVAVFDASGQVVASAVTASEPQHAGSASFTISADGDYTVDIKGTSDWTLSIAPS